MARITDKKAGNVADKVYRRQKGDQVSGSQGKLEARWAYR